MGHKELSYAELRRFWVQPTTLSSMSGGTLPPNKQQQTLVRMEMIPKFVNSSGLFEGWVVFETDASDASPQSFSNKIPQIASKTLFGKQLWVQLRLLVTSVFVCPSFPVQTDVLPFERVSTEWKVLNVDTQPLLVFANSFHMNFAENGNGSIVQFSFANGMQTALLAKDRTFGNWLTLSPTAVTIAPKSTRIFRASLRYPSKRLRIKNVSQDFVAASYTTTFRFRLSVLTWEKWRSLGLSAQSGDDRTLSLATSFLPGSATPVHSSVIAANNQTEIGRGVDVHIRLSDVFGTPGAKAINHCSKLPPFSTNRLPCLNVEMHPLNADLDRSSIKLRFPPRTQNARRIRSFSFSVMFQVQGDAQISVRLNNVSITGSPLVLQTKTVSCHEHEVPNARGTKCLCEAGRYRIPMNQHVGSHCVPCEEGRFQPEPSNIEQCPLCPSDQFSTPGSKRCYPCPVSGFKCVKGKLLMEDGFWCEVCSSNSETGASNETVRRLILSRLQSFGDIQMHRCNPEKACVINQTRFLTECKRGHKGPLCSVCEDGYVKTDGTCLVCNQSERATILLSLWVIVEFAIVAGLNIDESKSKTSTGNRTSNADARTASNVHKMKSSSFESPAVADKLVDQYKEKSSVAYIELLVLLIVDYLQVCSIIGRTQYNPYAGTLMLFGEVTKLFLMDPTTLDSFRCLSQLGFFARSLISLLFPWFLAVLSVALYSLLTAIQNSRKAETRNTTWKDSFKPVVTIIGQIHSAVTMTVISVFDLYPHEIRGHLRPTADLSFKIEEQEYLILAGLGGFTLFAVVLGWPFMMIGYYSWRCRTATTATLREDFLDDIKGFRVCNSGFLWPAFVILRKVLLLLVVSFVASPLSQAALTIVIFLLFQDLVTWIRPYQQDSPLNVMEILKSLAFSVTVCLGVLRHTTWSTQTAFAVIITVQLAIAVAALASFVLLSPAIYREVVTKWKSAINAISARRAKLSSLLSPGVTKKRSSSLAMTVQDPEVLTVSRRHSGKGNSTDGFNEPGKARADRQQTVGLQRRRDEEHQQIYPHAMDKRSHVNANPAFNGSLHSRSDKQGESLASQRSRNYAIEPEENPSLRWSTRRRLKRSPLGLVVNDPEVRGVSRRPSRNVHATDRNSKPDKSRRVRKQRVGSQRPCGRDYRKAYRHALDESGYTKSNPSFNGSRHPRSRGLTRSKRRAPEHSVSPLAKGHSRDYPATSEENPLLRRTTRRRLVYLPTSYGDIERGNRGKVDENSNMPAD
eukprot:gb/GECG01000920.1/.p1 GENE.gb/GECG01000920.1/~~gb/GECG01000920.1/.p1  ORF type:complete len:1250 (+),score=102.82 gb/GECG01000920.1/:1-3750(+)